MLIRDLYAIICDDIKDINPCYHKYVKMWVTHNSLGNNFDKFTLTTLFNIKITQKLLLLLNADKMYSLNLSKNIN